MWAKVALLAAAAVLFSSIAPHASVLPGPRLILWAWERPEDLRFIDPATTGVAYLAATLTLRPDGQTWFRSRHQPLLTPSAAARIAVVRIESPARYLFPEPRELGQRIAQIGRDQHAGAIQIDFDARASERPFYKTLLSELRKQSSLPIGVTALASWCDGDRWLDGQPISEAVPMFFRMGRNESRTMPVTAPLCRSSMGVSMDEDWPSARGARLYVFNPHPWSRSDYAAVLSRAREWK